MLSAKERVTIGAAFLDEAVGPDWFEKVDLDQLDLESGCKCVAAQIVGGFEGGYQNAWEYAMIEWGIIHVGDGLGLIDMDKAKRLGFVGVTADETPADWRHLEQEWRNEIERRIGEREAVPA